VLDDQCFAGIGASDVRAVLDVMHGRDPVGIVNRQVAVDAGMAQSALKATARASARDEDGTISQAAGRGAIDGAVSIGHRRRAVRFAETREDKK
jgi:hypothetical protein